MTCILADLFAIFGGLSLHVAGLAAWDTLLADARDCRDAWAMLAEVARWGTSLIDR